MESFRVNKPLWRESYEKGLMWTSTKPSHYVSYMEQGTIFIFSGIYKEESQDIHFLAISPGTSSIIDEVELTIKELESLVSSDLLKFKDLKDIKEISITPFGTLIQDPDFNHPIYLPNEIYIIMGKNEYKNSVGKLAVGKKISLFNLVSAYSIAIGHGLIKV